MAMITCFEGTLRCAAPATCSDRLVPQYQLCKMCSMVHTLSMLCHGTNLQGLRTLLCGNSQLQSCHGALFKVCAIAGALHGLYWKTSQSPYLAGGRACPQCLLKAYKVAPRPKHTMLPKRAATVDACERQQRCVCHTLYATPWHMPQSNTVSLVAKNCLKKSWQFFPLVRLPRPAWQALAAIR